MNDKDIVKIERIKNVQILDKPQGELYPPQDILKITFRNGNYRILDLFDYFDITDNNDYKVVYCDNSKSYDIFKEKEV